MSCDKTDLPWKQRWTLSQKHCIKTTDLQLPGERPFSIEALTTVSKEQTARSLIHMAPTLLITSYFHIMFLWGDGVKGDFRLRLLSKLLAGIQGTLVPVSSLLEEYTTFPKRSCLWISFLWKSRHRQWRWWGRRSQVYFGLERTAPWVQSWSIRRQWRIIHCTFSWVTSCLTSYESLFTEH